MLFISVICWDRNRAIFEFFKKKRVLFSFGNSTTNYNSIKKITDRTSQMGYAFVNVSPRIKKFGDNKVELTFEIEEGTKIFIDFLSI